MAYRPFLGNISKGRSFYGPALEANGAPQDYWTDEEQRPIVSNSQAGWNTFKFGAVLGGAFAAGFLPTRTGNVWDKYLGAIKSAEEYSPFGVLRTLQFSNFFSSYASSVRNANLFVGPDQLAKNDVYRRYLSHVIGGNVGGNMMRLGTEGVTLRGNRLFWGQGEQVALRYASALTASGHGASQRISAAYARHLGMGGKIPYEHFFAQLDPSIGVQNPNIGGFAATIIGGQSRGQAVYRRASAVGGELVERFNRLLNVPFENKFLQSTIGKYINLGVKSGSGLSTLGRLSTKYGLALGGLTLGYQSLDYFVDHSSLFEGTGFEEGLTTGLATMGVKANLASSRAAGALGLHAYREKQEEIAPGSTDLLKLSAFPAMGAMGMGLSAYALKVYEMFRMRRMSPGPWGGQKMPAAMARQAVEKSMEEWGGQSILSKAGKWLSAKLPGKMGPVGLAGFVGGSLGALAVLPFVPGALVPGKRPEELEALYSGKQDVAVRKGRWWSFGRTPYEGERISYFRPHWYARMRMDARDKAIWGDEDLTLLEKWYKREFTYDLERKHYEDRPYPITSLPFEDVPLIGPLLANTIGRIIKPPQLMHTEEWMGSGGATKGDYPRFGERIATEVGQVPGGAPIAPYSPSQVAGEEIYRMTEMIGLPGFLASTVKQNLTGTQDWFDQMKQLESARRIDGMERWYWDQELGDMFMTNEALRRLYPHRRRQIDLYNPIRNTMPEWMPGSGEKSPDFLHGDPYTKVPEGELRLPGKGYEARYPQLEGVAPEDYPALHKFKILADIAPYSDKFGEALGDVRKVRATKGWTTEDEEVYQTTLDQIKQRKQGSTFQEYQYLSPMGELFGSDQAEESSSLQALLNQRKAAGLPDEPGTVRRLFGGYWELLSHNAETSLDLLTPMAPGAKLVHQRTAIEAYERDQLYGTKSAFWHRPIRDFIAPFMRSVAYSLGAEGVPDVVEGRRAIDQYFDILRYTKYSRLSNMAQSQGDREAFTEFERKKDQTLFGINPFTRSYENVLRALPKKERDYFTAFEQADTEDERRRVLEMVPENEKALYAARWKLLNVDEIRKAAKEGILSEAQVEEANTEIQNFYAEAENEGFPTSKELFAEYAATRLRGENYADWYRRTYLLQGVSLPGPDWVGWHPSVDLEDIKLKLVQTLGEDMHDYDLWESRAKQLPYKPYIDEESVEAILNQGDLTKEQMRDRINQIMAAEGLEADTFASSLKLPSKKDQIDVEVETDRSDEMGSIIRKMA